MTARPCVKPPPANRDRCTAEPCHPRMTRPAGGSPSIAVSSGVVCYGALSGPRCRSQRCRIAKALAGLQIRREEPVRSGASRAVNAQTRRGPESPAPCEVRFMPSSASAFKGLSIGNGWRGSAVQRSPDEAAKTKVHQQMERTSPMLKHTKRNPLPHAAIGRG